MEKQKMRLFEIGPDFSNLEDLEGVGTELIFLDFQAWIGCDF